MNEAMASDRMTLYVSAGDPLGARAVNHWRATGQIPPDCEIKTSEITPPGYGFLAPPLYSRQRPTILKFEDNVSLQVESRTQ